MHTVVCGEGVKMDSAIKLNKLVDKTEGLTVESRMLTKLLFIMNDTFHPCITSGALLRAAGGLLSSSSYYVMRSVSQCGVVSLLFHTPTLP